MKQDADVRDRLAAERTFLAWIRTRIALMGFGFVVARFGLFLQQFRVIQGVSFGTVSCLSLWFGTALIVAGVVTNVLSAPNHARLVRDLDQGARAQSRPSIFGNPKAGTPRMLAAPSSAIDLPLKILI
jgi:putative membrane protein